MSADVADLARLFSDVVQQWTTPGQFAEIKLRNATPEYAGCCVSHDFMDANMAMDEAFRLWRGFGPLDRADTLSDADIALWNAAWSQAKADWVA